MSDNRRDFLKKGALLGLSGLASSLLGKNQLDAVERASEQLATGGAAFTLPALPYAYDALEPFIDKQTMEIHHGKHHKAYVDKLNAADLSSVNLSLSDYDKCSAIDQISPALIRNNLGGHYNHSLFWTLLHPNQKNLANLPTGKILNAINTTFKSFDDFKKEFSEKALKLFGSGWCWLIIDEQGKLKITTTANQDNPLMKVATDKGRPILALDVWEHAYYLKYQNKRVDYISNWWSIINWQKAEELFNSK
jgi:superoxide dismutase, Fe-Mn family